ncbi:hypothetical protein [Flavobacterium sp. H122]|uniref:hypothetical protein n=1 Tax=Flavobacterium sp. H122 TaxID=2529860 RepID=UPI0010AA1176|nr:hypothetical protein [Flavobacterium sp. H122]
MFLKVEIRKIVDYIFNDGHHDNDVKEIYDNYFTSCDFEVFSKSFVKVCGEKIMLFGSNNIKLKNEVNSDDSFLSEIADKFDLILKIDGFSLKCVVENHFFDDFFFLNYDEKYIIIYGLGGSKFVESIYIHGLWEVLKD